MPKSGRPRALRRRVVLGFDAFETGKRLFPLSVALLIAALTGPKLAARLAPKRVCQAGLVALTIAAFFLVGTIDVELNDTGFAISLAVFGIGAGLLLSQLGNVIMSSVHQSKSNEAGGLQGTAQNLGASLGTALIGAVLISGLTPGFVSRIKTTPRSRQPSRRSSPRPSRPASRSSRSRTSRRRYSTRTCRRPRRRPSRRTTATPSSRR